MKTIIYAVVLMLGSLIYGQENSTITVAVNNATSDVGKMHFALYTKGSFMKKPDASATGIIKDGKTVVTFENIEPGVYAILCFQDKNENERMDFELNGMPKEPYGMSNNEYLMGPPTWESTKFTVKDEPLVIEIRL